MQAIALPLALATRRITDIADFNWSGFLPGRYWRNGAPKIELTVTFTPAERQATRDIAHRWYANQSDDLRSSHPFVSLKPCTNESFLDENFTVLKVYQN